MTSATASGWEACWLLWMLADILFVLALPMAVAFMGADKLSSGAWFGLVGLTAFLAVFAIPAWAVFGLAGPDEGAH